ncbi:F-box-like protein [Ceratobasidium sp. AG-Ba]|nr:F-box-like protein [Ceratobasidium sp. AG-Ba]
MCNERKREERKRLLSALLETLRHDTCCPKNPTRSVALKELEQREEELLQVEDVVRRELCAVRRRRNSNLPINALPTELLGFIFGLVIDSAPKSFASAVGRWPFTDNLPQLDTTSGANTRDYDFHYALTLTAVCKHWREATVASARLWSTIYPSRSKLVPLQIERAKEAGFDVILTAKHTNKSASKYLATPTKCSIPYWPEPLTNHLRQLIVQFDESQMQQWTATLCSATAPHLETLCISVTRHANVVYTEPLFGGVAPRLRSLTLSGFVVPWDSVIFTDLRDLTLRQHKTIHRPTMPEFLDLLGRSPRLRRLALELSGPQPPSAEFEHNTNNISLPNLAHVVLHDIAPHVVALLVHHTTFPSSAQLAISHGPHTLHAVDTHVLSMFTRFRTPLLRARKVRLLPWNIGADKPGAAYTSGSGLLEMHVHPDLARVKDVVDGIVRTPLRYVDTLVMENLSISDPELVVGLLRHIHTVQTLSVLDCTFDAIVVRALADPEKNLLPELRELTVSGHEAGEDDIRALIDYRKGNEASTLERLFVRHCTRLTPEFVGWVESGAWL